MAQKHVSTISTNSNITPINNELANSGWFPAPQPSLSIDTLSTWIVISGLGFYNSWSFLITNSFSGNSILSAVATSSFLLALLSFLSLSTRLSSEFYREHYGYNIPLGKRNLIYHTSFKLGVISFYFGIFLLIGIASWSLMESNRILGSLVILGLGILIIVISSSLFWHMMKHPIGIATDLLYTSHHKGYGGIVNNNNISPTVNDTTSIVQPTATNNTNPEHHTVLSGWIRKPNAVPFPYVISTTNANTFADSHHGNEINNNNPSSIFTTTIPVTTDEEKNQ